MPNQAFAIATLVLATMAISGCGEQYKLLGCAPSGKSSGNSPGKVPVCPTSQDVQDGTLEMTQIPAEIELGQTVTLKVKTTPYTRVSIEVQDILLSELLSLRDRNSDEKGIASWTFRLNNGYKADVLPIIVSADVNGTERKLVSKIPIVRQSEAASDFPLSLLSMVPSVPAGGRVRATVKTLPGAKVQIEAQGAGFPQASSLLERTADKDGTVTWDWQVRENYEADRMPVIITSSYGQKEKKLVTAIDVLPGEVDPSSPQKVTSPRIPSAASQPQPLPISAKKSRVAESHPTQQVH